MGLQPHITTSSPEDALHSTCYSPTQSASRVIRPSGIAGVKCRIHATAFAIPQELEALLHYNGFKVESHTGDFDGKPITAATESQVVVARARPPTP